MSENVLAKRRNILWRGGSFELDGGQIERQKTWEKNGRRCDHARSARSRSLHSSSTFRAQLSLCWQYRRRLIISTEVNRRVLRVFFKFPQVFQRRRVIAATRANGTRTCRARLVCGETLRLNAGNSPGDGGGTKVEHDRAQGYQFPRTS